MAVFIELKDQPRKRLVFRHRDLRDVVTETKQQIGELMADPFGGWPHLLRYGLRLQDASFTLNNASDLIDQWMDEQNDLDALGRKIVDALKERGYLKFDELPPEKESPEAGSPESTS